MEKRSDMANFLATDDVPETLFGIPVVSDPKDYTEADVAFFKKHPEAGGYYDMEDTENQVTENPVGADKGGKYDTAIPAEKEQAYQTWRSTLPKPLQYEGDYDLRGYWMDPSTKKTAVSGDHFIDKYKKPNHPTFSVESKYAVGRDAVLAGTWSDDGKYVPNPGAIYERAIRDAVPFVKEHEGFRPVAYRKKLGFDKKTGKTIWDKWTIGYGQTEIDGRPVKQGDTIDEPTAAKFVDKRVRQHAADLYRDLQWSRNFKNPGTLSAMYDIMYNAGPAIFNEKNSPNLNKAMKNFKGDYDAYMWKEQIPTYRNKANGVPLKGLKNRNNDMTALFGPKKGFV